MATLVSAKNILLKYDVNAPTNEKGDKYRGTAHEFQDYAYKLASDLNDLENLKIYMKFAKTYPRYLLEEAYQFVSDVQEERKGRLYMWKFKQIRQKYKLKKDLKNFDYDFVMSKMKKVRDDLSSKIIAKNNNFSDNYLVKYLESIQNLIDLSDVKTKVLIIGNECPILPSVFVKNTKQIYGIEVSPKISKNLKGLYGNPIARKFISKDFFKNTYNDLNFDFIVVNKFWNYLPIEKEHEFVQELYRLLNIGGKLIVTNKSSNSADQKWRRFTVGTEDRYFFEKVSSDQELQSLYNNYGFSVANDYVSDKISISLFTK